MRARVLVIGLGGLGSPAALYLAAAGVGTIGLLDSDRVELSNLQRQILHNTSRVGGSKIDSAREALHALNPEANVVPLAVRFTSANADDIVSGFDAVIEASDNFETKFLVNDVCLELKKPFATAGILAMDGHALFVVPGRTACLRCVMPEIPVEAPTTAQFGVLGAVPGILGSVQAFEVIRWIVGFWREPDNGMGRLHSVDGETMRLHTARVPRQVQCRCAATERT